MDLSVRDDPDTSVSDAQAVKTEHPRRSEFAKTRRLARMFGWRSALGRYAGLDGRRGSRRRFRRFLLGLRYGLMPVTLILFLIPQPAYHGSWLRLGLLGCLFIWTVIYGKLVARKSNSERAIRLAIIDVIVVSALFYGSFVSDNTDATSGYSGALIRGSFQPQTYAPLFTAGAILGATRGLKIAGLSSLLYLIALAASHISLTQFIDNHQIPTLALSIAMYFVIAALVGIYSTMVDRFDGARSAATSRWIDATMNARETGRIEGREEAEAHIHDKILTPVRFVQRYLEVLAPRLSDDARTQVLAAARFLDATLKRERFNRGRYEETTDSIVDIVNATYWSQKVFDVDGRLDDCIFEPSVLITQPETARHFEAEARVDMSEILFQAIENAFTHSRGQIAVRLIETQTAGGAGYTILVEDDGPLKAEPDGRGQGLINVRRRAGQQGWTANFERGNGNVGSRFSLVIPGPPASESRPWYSRFGRR